MIQDKIFFDEKDPTGVSYNTPFTVFGSYQGRLWSKTPTGSIKFYTQNSDLSVYATTGSNQFSGSQTVTGSLTVTGGITGSVTTASYVEYTGVANKPALVSGSSQVTYSGLTGVPSGIVSSSAQVGGYGVFATTGSNQFNGSQAVTGSLTVTGQVVAQTLNVQQVTSSIVYSSGSNIFGNSLGNTQQFTGSVSVTGSLTVVTAGTEFQVTSTGVNLGNALTDSHIISGSLTVNPNGLFVSGSGNVGIGTTSPSFQLDLGGGTTNNTRLRLQRGSDDTAQNALYGWNSITVQRTNVALSSAQTDFSIIQQGSDGSRTPFYISTGGNVFINNSSGVTLNDLTNRLSVSSTTYNLFDISRFSDNAFGPNFYLVKSRNGSIGGNTIVANGDNLGNIAWLGANGTGFTDAASIKAEVDGTPGASDMPGRLVFSTTADGTTNNTERMRITSAGNVGIGTTSPSGPLHVYSAATGGLGGHIILDNNGTAVGNETALLFSDGGITNTRAAISSTVEDAPYFGDIKFKTGLTTYGSLNTRMIIKGGGNIGIGTTTPATLLNLKSSTTTELRLESIGGTYRSFIGFRTDGQKYDLGVNLNDTLDSLSINYAGTERLRITSAGKIGIQNTDPQGKLEVGIVANNSTYGGHFFSTFFVPINTWTTVFTAPNNTWAAITEFTWTSSGDYNRSGAAYMRWAYNGGAAALGVVYTLFNDSQNSTATFRNSGGAIQVYITGGAADYYVQVRIQGSKAA